jgi:hypothetical protein
MVKMKDIAIQEKRFGINKGKKKKYFWKQFLLIIFIVVAVCSVLLAIQGIIKNNIEKLSVANDLNSIWISSLASYWGGILCGVISGTLAIIGVVWTIRYYKDSDAAKSRVEHMPFLIFELKDIFSADDIHRVQRSKKVYTVDCSNEKDVEPILCRMKISNIGQGFASVLVLHTGENIGGIAYRELIKIGDEKEVVLKILPDKKFDEREVSFGIQYIDCMTNEYVQEYCLTWCDDIYTMKIEQGYPRFMGQTHDIGKFKH